MTSAWSPPDAAQDQQRRSRLADDLVGDESPGQRRRFRREQVVEVFDAPLAEEARLAVLEDDARTVRAVQQFDRLPSLLRRDKGMGHVRIHSGRFYAVRGAAWSVLSFLCVQ